MPDLNLLTLVEVIIIISDKFRYKSSCRKAVSIFLSFLTHERTETSNKAVTCHYRAHCSFPSNKTYNHPLRISLICPAEVIGNP